MPLLLQFSKQKKIVKLLKYNKYHLHAQVHAPLVCNTPQNQKFDAQSKLYIQICTLSKMPFIIKVTQ
jgi:hypothetical protein